MEKDRKILIVINPASGRSSYESKLQYLQNELEKAVNAERLFFYRT
jgi:diacylglycerol kinase family enzyme